MSIIPDIGTGVPSVSTLYHHHRIWLDYVPYSDPGPQLYRKYPGIIQNEWAERIISLMDDLDLGVALSVTSLIMALVRTALMRTKRAMLRRRIG